MKVKVRIGLYLAAFLTAAAVSAYLTAFLVIRGGSPEVAAPLLVGLDREAAERTAHNNNLLLRVEAEDFSDEVPRGHVASQDPPAGFRLKENQIVRVVLSRGSRVLPIPDLKGLSLEQAVSILSQGRLGIGLLSYTYGLNPKQGPDRVVAQSPLPLTPVTAGTKVDLLLSLGPRPFFVSMPDLTGMSYGQALSTLEKSRLVLGKVINDDRPDWPRDAVLLQAPPPGRRVAAGSLVRLTMNRSEESITQAYRFKVTEYTIPNGFLRREIRMTAYGEYFSWEVFHKWIEPGQRIRVAALVHGGSKIKIFEDGREIDRQ